MTRVVILLSTPAGFLSAYFPNDREAEEFIESWVKFQRDQISLSNPENGTTAIPHLTTVLTGADPQTGRIGWSVVAKAIVGMYIAPGGPTAQDRIADAI